MDVQRLNTSIATSIWFWVHEQRPQRPVHCIHPATSVLDNPPEVHIGPEHDGGAQRKQGLGCKRKAQHELCLQRESIPREGNGSPNAECYPRSDAVTTSLHCLGAFIIIIHAAGRHVCWQSFEGQVSSCTWNRSFYLEASDWNLGTSEETPDWREKAKSTELILVLKLNLM